MRKKNFSFLLGLISFASISLSSATPVSPICQHSYYKGVMDTFLFEKYQNEMLVPWERYWVVIDVTNLTNADRIVMAMKLKEQGYNPVLVRVKDRVWLVAYASNSYSDAEGVAKSLPVGKGEIVKKPYYFQKIYFSRVCSIGGYTGIRGMEVLLAKLDSLARKNLTASKYLQFKELLKAMEELLNQPTSPPISTLEFFEETLGGQ